MPIAQSPTVISRTELSNTFLGSLIQVCIVTWDHRRTVEGLIKLGIGPWRVRTYDSSNMTQRTYRGQPGKFSMIICGATSAGINWEVVEPIEGPSIYLDFLDRHGDGVQHLAFNCAGTSYEERLSRLGALGYEVIQSGVIDNRVPFAYFGTEADAKTVIEVFDIPEDFKFAAPDVWIPGPAP